ncbi:hypothetical protein ACFQH5_18870 [Halomonas salifodinae]|uniref:Uncharacterized protein n=1 Tax=Halomonas salifodinae TaxID=438745 RepID=A0ABW2F047_9GAMM
MKEQDGPLIPTPIPALVAVLLSKEREKGSPLTESEVLEVRDNAACMMLPLSAREKMEEARGYPDIDPEFSWEHWQEARRQFDQIS